MNKLIIPIIVISILAAGIGAYFIFQKPAVPETKSDTPYYFIAIHNEPHNSEPESRKKIEQSYAILKEMVNRANEYNIKLTLMFTAQWADYISESPERMADLESWKKYGHEIAAHHHSIYHGNWDGYTDYTKEEAEAQRIKQGKTPEEYLGTFNDYVKKLKKLNPNIHSGCMNAEDKKEMPDEIYYDTCSGFANYGEPGKREGDNTTPEKGKNEYITVGVYKNIARKWLAHYQTTLDRRQQKAQEVFNSMNSGVYGSVNHSAIHEESAFYSWLEFLHSKDPTGEKSKTVSEIIDQKLIPEKLIPEELVNKRFLPLPQNKCGDNICDEIEKANPNLCPRDCEKKQEGTCKNLCGDGICQEAVCMAIGCPCSESPETCPGDCKQTSYIFDKSRFCPDQGDCGNHGLESRKCSKIGDCVASCAYGCVSKKWMEGRIDCEAIWENFECECIDGICQRK